MFDTYQKIFQQRAAQYHAAMADYPDIRRQEFEHAVRLLDILPAHTVCDVPAGGGYLSRYLPAPAHTLFMETSHEFAAHCPTHAGNAAVEAALESLPVASASIDRLLSLAALHHVPDKRLQFEEFCRLMRPEGRVVVADVEEGSATGAFLNEFVDRFNSMGHEGLFLNPDDLQTMEDSGLRIEQVERPEITWAFDNENDLADFCQKLFGLDLATKRDIVSGVEDYLRPRRDDTGVELDWQLLYVAALRQ